MTANIKVTDDYGCERMFDDVPNFSPTDHLIPCNACHQVVFIDEMLDADFGEGWDGCVHCTHQRTEPSTWSGTFIRNVYTWNSGGGCMIDEVELAQLIIGLNDECIIVFKDRKQYDAYHEGYTAEHVCTIHTTGEPEVELPEVKLAGLVRKSKCYTCGDEYEDLQVMGNRELCAVCFVKEMISGGYVSLNDVLPTEHTHQGLVDNMNDCVQRMISLDNQLWACEPGHGPLINALKQLMDHMA